MKRAMLMLLAAVVVAATIGCAGPHHKFGRIPGSCQMAPENCAACPPGAGMAGCGMGGCGDQGAAFTPGPPTAAVAYPYYTVHGPRDFLARSPRAIGP
ncbi:MAG: hypothetical protein ACOY3P_07865 [Planctomycetota bacterium]